MKYMDAALKSCLSPHLLAQKCKSIFCLVFCKHIWNEGLAFRRYSLPAFLLSLSTPSTQPSITPSRPQTPTVFLPPSGKPLHNDGCQINLEPFCLEMVKAILVSINGFIWPLISHSPQGKPALLSNHHYRKAEGWVTLGKVACHQWARRESTLSHSTLLTPLPSMFFTQNHEAWGNFMEDCCISFSFPGVTLPEYKFFLWDNSLFLF